MNVLVACEASGVVRDAFTARGHFAISCDLVAVKPGSLHYPGDVRDLLTLGMWDLMIAHPPCDHLAISGASWFAEKRAAQHEALEFVRELLAAPIPRIALENPISIISTKIRKPDQIIHPWMFGHEETKATCLWLKNLPLLNPTKVMQKRDANLTPTRQNNIGRSSYRAYVRSRTYEGIAEAMALQWGVA